MTTTIVASKGAKVDLNKSGTSGIVNTTVRNNIQGVSKAMEKKGWLDSQGQKGKVTLTFAPSSWLLACSAFRVTDNCCIAMSSARSSGSFSLVTGAYAGVAVARR